MVHVQRGAGTFRPASRFHVGLVEFHTMWTIEKSWTFWQSFQHMRLVQAPGMSHANPNLEEHWLQLLHERE